MKILDEEASRERLASLKYGAEVWVRGTYQGLGTNGVFVDLGGEDDVYVPANSVVPAFKEPS